MTLAFASDYQEGCHPEILEALNKTNSEKTEGYGTDSYSALAKAKILEACGISNGEVYLLVGGTQTNEVVISSFLKPYEGVIAADTGHISTHEAGAIEHGGHKVLTLKHEDGKISAERIEAYCADFYADGNHEHMVHPGMVYLSQPTEYGTLYSLKELEAIREVCDKYDLYLYIDGARLAYALASKENDVSLKDLGRLTDVFYIGGTKCGTLFGEALVVRKKDTIPHLFTLIKQHGALLAKGRILGVQFYKMFEDGLYERIAKEAIRLADRLRHGLEEKGYEQTIIAPTNQIFISIDDKDMADLASKVNFSFWEKKDATHTVIRFVVSWSTSEEEVDALLEIL